MADKSGLLDEMKAAGRADGSRSGGSGLKRDGAEDGRISVDVAPTFVHLHVLSSFSLLESALPLARLIDLAIADGQPALAVTDRNNLFGALEFSEKAAAKGLQPIIGCKLSVDFGDEEQGSRTRSASLRDYPNLVLLCANQTGYENLMRLVSKAHLGENFEHEEEAATVGMEGHSGFAEPSNPPITDVLQSGPPCVSIDDLVDGADGLICLSGGVEGPLNQALTNSRDDLFKSRAAILKRAFGDRLYIELQRHGRDDRKAEPQLVDLAYDEDLPLVATNQPYFPEREDFAAHDALVCISEGVVVNMEDRRRLTEEHYFKSQREMAMLFADLPEAIENSVEIAKRCAFKVETCQPILPRFTTGDVDGSDEAAALEAETRELVAQAKAGLRERLDQYGTAPGFEEKDYEERLDFELGVIEQMGFPGYFLIVADFIKWAKQQDIPVGPGRGSGAGSLVAWSLTVTDIDPMRFSLLFERFLNPERVSMPDFDIDFCQDRREEVIRYVQAKYGRDQVAQIITFGTLQARAVLRDVGRVLQMPYGQVDRLCKLVPNNPANPTPLSKAVIEEPGFAEARKEEEIVEHLINISLKLEGLYRHASTHAAGIVIGDRRLDKLVPLYRDPRSDMPVTQFNMKWVEQAGLVKFDFLGLKTLTVLETALKFMRERGVDVDLAAIPLDDVDTYQMLSRGETVGVFQLESQGMRKALLGMKPDAFEDIIALVALYRPGPMDNIPLYNRVKHGEEEITSIHPLIDHLVAETQGVIVYQEQVMQIAQELAGYSLGEADLLRRAMGKKIRAEMDKQRVRFVEGAQQKGLTEAKANEIFDLLAKFADYGFNKSHAAAYALVSYQTAFLKSGYPVEFLAASMQLDMGNTDKLNVFRQEARAQGIEVVSPSVQTSETGFSVKDGKILYALAAIKGVGEGAVQQIVSERKENGPYKSLTDFFNRIDIRQANKRTLENLVCAGALDCFGFPREQMLAGMDRLVAHASRTAQNRETGQNDMFGGASDEEEAIELPAFKPWMPSEKLLREFQSIGFYLSAHPLDEYRKVMEAKRIQFYADFERGVKNGDVNAGRLAGTIASKQERKTRTGKRMAIIMLSDPSGQYEAVMFEEQLEQFRDLLEPGNSVILQAGADMRPEGVSIRVQAVMSLEQEASRVKQDLRVFIRDEQPVSHVQPLLAGRGESRVSIILLLEDGGREVEVQLKDRYRISPEVASAIKSVPGVVDVELV